MSNSARAILRRRCRSHLSKYQRDILSKQHFGDMFVYQGRPLRIGQVKAELMKGAK